jgi:hypothetical protein
MQEGLRGQVAPGAPDVTAGSGIPVRTPADPRSVGFCVGRPGVPSPRSLADRSNRPNPPVRSLDPDRSDSQRRSRMRFRSDRRNRSSPRIPQTILPWEAFVCALPFGTAGTEPVSADAPSRYPVDARDRVCQSDAASRRRPPRRTSCAQPFGRRSCPHWPLSSRRLWQAATVTILSPLRRRLTAITTGDAIRTSAMTTVSRVMTMALPTTMDTRRSTALRCARGCRRVGTPARGTGNCDAVPESIDTGLTPTPEAHPTSPTSSRCPTVTAAVVAAAAAVAEG